MGSLRSSSLTPFAPVVLTSPVFVLAAAPLSPTHPHRDRTSRLPSLVGGPSLRSGPPTPSHGHLAAADGGRSEARATAVLFKYL